MKKNDAFSFLYITSFAFLFTGCFMHNNPSDVSSYHSDSLAIVQTIKNAYRWNEDTASAPHIEFPLFSKNDTILGIDQTELEKSITLIKKTDLFSNTFLTQYRLVAHKIDSCFKKDTATYSDGIPPYGPYDYDLFCDCQDGPDDPIASMQFDSLKISDTSASLVWKWKEWNDKAPYYIKLVKENNHWKIANLLGLDELPNY